MACVQRFRSDSVSPGMKDRSGGRERRPLARRPYQFAHSLWSQPGRNGLTDGSVKRLDARMELGLAGVDRHRRRDLMRCRGRRRLPDGDGTNDRVIVATIDVEASRMLVLGHMALPFLANRSARFCARCRDRSVVRPRMTRSAACHGRKSLDRVRSGVHRLLPTWDCLRPTKLPSRAKRRGIG